ncbi:MAG: HEPN domain-containing protein, partial [Syntrophales bacterium]|nr:HEPN domain-containing protein [Syntrophales bacterium]
MEKEDIVKYWIESSDSDFQVMESLFENEHYVWALFLGHLVVEKLLKAYHVRNVDADYPRIHNLLEIAHKASLELSDEQKLTMSELTAFNLRARYPDYKNRFQKKADRQYTETHLSKIREIRKWLQEK